jgi:glutamine amidotransferase
MAPRVGIVGYRMGNIMSLTNALGAVGADAFVAGRPEELEAATHAILPGVGAFPRAMHNLRELGFLPALRRWASEKRPLLGVCLGMQLLGSVGEEHQPCEGLGLVPGRVVRLDPPGLRVPHVGWNDTVTARDDRLFGAAGSVGCFYYVHSYHLVPEREDDVVGSCDYGGRVVAAVARENVWGVQFHPEKSHRHGLELLRRFTQVQPC